MTLKSTDIPPVKPADQAAVPKSGDQAMVPKPEDRELARKLGEQTSLETELTERELRTASLRAELGAFERQYLHFVGSRYAELDELKAQIAEQNAADQPDNERAQRLHATLAPAQERQISGRTNRPMQRRKRLRRRPK